MVFSHFAVLLSQLTIFQMSVKWQLETSFLLKPFEFCYFLLNLFDPASIAVVWFCSFTFIFCLLFFNEILKPTFCRMKFWKMFIIAEPVTIYSNSFISCRTAMSVCKNRSWSNNHYVKYLVMVSKVVFYSMKRLTFS